MNIRKITAAVMTVTILAGMTACSDTANETAEVSETTTIAETTTVAETTATTAETTSETTEVTVEDESVKATKEYLIDIYKLCNDIEYFGYYPQQTEFFKGTCPTVCEWVREERVSKHQEECGGTAVAIDYDRELDLDDFFSKYGEETYFNATRKGTTCYDSYDVWLTDHCVPNAISVDEEGNYTLSVEEKQHYEAWGFDDFEFVEFSDSICTMNIYCADTVEGAEILDIYYKTYTFEIVNDMWQYSPKGYDEYAHVFELSKDSEKYADLIANAEWHLFE